jgi:hypothetical protein
LRKRRTKLAIILMLTTLMVLYNHCGSPFGVGGGKGSVEFKEFQLPPDQQPPSQEGVSTPGNPLAIDPAKTVQAFEQTVYPLTRQYCVNCHGMGQQPVHADPDSQVAHDSVLNSFKVNFQNPGQSRMVLKLSQSNHNCWSNDCSADAAQMQAAIESWYQMSLSETNNNNNNNGGTGIIGNGVEIPTSDSNMLSTYYGADDSQDPNTVVIDMYASTIKAPFVKAADPISGLNFIGAPNGTGFFQPDDPNAGVANIEYEIRESGIYKMFGLVYAP